MPPSGFLTGPRRATCGSRAYHFTSCLVVEGGRSKPAYLSYDFERFWVVRSPLIRKNKKITRDCQEIFLKTPVFSSFSFEFGAIYCAFLPLEPGKLI